MDAGKGLEDETCSQQAILIRRSPIWRKRSKPRRGQPTKQEKEALRLAVYIRANGKCQLLLHKDCSQNRVLPFEGEVMYRAHLVHLKSRASGGKWTMENCLIGCNACHIGSMHTEGKHPA